MVTVNFLARLVEHHQVLVYALIFLLIVIEGEFILLCTGILVHLGALNFPLTLVFVLCAGLTKTFLGYYVGSLIYEKWHNARFPKYIEKHVFNMMPHFERKPFWSIFISKFLMVNHMVIIFAGYKKINYKKYLQAEMSSTLLWAPGLLLLGYFFSYAALKVSHEISRFSLIIIVLIASLIIFDKLIGWAYQIFEELYDTE